MSQTLSASDVASHNKPDNLWVIVDEQVYDLTKFQEEHPGGKKSQCSLSVKLSSSALTVHDVQSSNESPAKTPRSNSGSTTTNQS